MDILDEFQITSNFFSKVIALRDLIDAKTLARAWCLNKWAPNKARKAQL